MADSRQTKIVTYKLQGNTTDLEKELKSAITSLDALDKKLTYISSKARMLGGKDMTNRARASAISTAESQIEKMQATLRSKKIQVVSPDQLNLIKHMAVELGHMGQNLDKIGNVSNVSQKELDKIMTTLRSMNVDLRNSNIILPKYTTAWNTFIRTMRRAAVALAAINQLIRYISMLHTAASEFVEVMNLFNVAAQESTDKLYELAEAMEDAFNADIRPILNSIAVFRQYANTMGFTADQANLLSENLTKISYDLASLYNTTYDDMMSAVKSGIAGQTKSLMQYGISVHKATLEQTALNLGLTKSWTAYTETEKVALRYIAILEQASLAQGDLARTLESPSNQLKIAKAQLEVFTRNLGALVVIVSNHVLPVFNGLMIAVNNFLEVMARAAGYEIPDYSKNLSSNNQLLEDGTESAEEYEEAIRGALVPLDEINQESQKDNSALGTGIDPAILEALKGYDNLMDRVSTKTDALAAAFGAVLEPELFEGVGILGGAAFSTLGYAIDTVTNALSSLSPVLNVVITLIGYLLQGAAWLIDHIATPTMAFVAALTDNIWFLIAAFTLLNATQLAVTGNMQSMMAVKLAQWFATLAVNIWENVAAYSWYIAASIKAKAAQIAEAAAAWWAASAWWQKAIAVIAAAGSMALVVGGIVAAATTAAKSQADSTMSSTPNVPAMANGGVVNAPTLAMIGEGKYNEAVIPLGNSPQFTSMKDDIADAVIRKIGPTPYGSYGATSRGARTPIILQVNGKELARALLPDIGDVQPQVGVALS